jgi:hypothetical protein
MLRVYKISWDQGVDALTLIAADDGAAINMFEEWAEHHHPLEDTTVRTLSLVSMRWRMTRPYRKTWVAMVHLPPGGDRLATRHECGRGCPTHRKVRSRWRAARPQQPECMERQWDTRVNRIEGENWSFVPIRRQPS